MGTTGESKVRSTKIAVTWTILAARLESEGQWQQLFSLVDSPHSNWSALPIRWQAALGRAAMFSGQPKWAEQIIHNIRNEASTCTETQIIALLTQASLDRRKQRWQKARELAARAKELALKHNHIQLEADARFAEAISFAEEGRVFLAIDLFQSIRNDKRKISQYRRGLSALNEAWCLWDLGQRHLLHSLLPQIPRPHRIKIEVYLAILENKTSALEHWVTHGFGKSEIYPLDLEQILLVLTEWYYLKSDLEQCHEKTWLYQELTRQSQEAHNKKLQCCLTLLEGKKLSRSDKEELDPVTHIELEFLYVLSVIKKNSVRARTYYKKHLTPLMQAHRLNTPLIPHWSELESPFSPWARSISYALGIYSLENRPATTNHSKTLKFRNGKLFLEDTYLFLDLSSSPVAESLLRILQGRKGRRFEKAELHYALNGTTYRAHLHDARLHKLFKRLANKIEKTLHVQPWTMPGDNTLMLCCNLEVE